MRYISLFSGIEAASCAWEPLGWEPVAFSEIDPFPSAVLQERYPNVPNLGDITKIDWAKVKEEHGAVDVVIGGSPILSIGANLRQTVHATKRWATPWPCLSLGGLERELKWWTNY